MIPPRKQTVDVAGLRAVKLGMPPAIGDLYYMTMQMSWPAFVALVSLVFVLLNLAFGMAYASLPGAIANMPPGSIVQSFFFSVETLGTVGYGNMAPASWLRHSIAAVEILVGLFFSTRSPVSFSRALPDRATASYSAMSR